VRFVDALHGFKTYLAVACLLGVSLYQSTSGEYARASYTFFSALATAGLRHAIARGTR
jgi:hypothetical protein